MNEMKSKDYQIEIKELQKENVTYFKTLVIEREYSSALMMLICVYFFAIGLHDAIHEVGLMQIGGGLFAAIYLTIFVLSFNRYRNA